MQKRLDYGFNGYQIPATPRSSRSARGKRLFKTKACDRKTCAFELLASVAGDLLCKNDAFPSNCGSSVGRTRESVKKFDDSVDHYVKTAKLRIPDLDGSFSVSNERIKQEVLDEVKPCRLEVYDQGSSDEALSSSRSGLGHQLCHAQPDTLVEDAPSRNDSASRYVSLITKCVISPQSPVGKSVVESADAPESWKLEPDVLQGNYGEHKGYPSDSIGSCEMKAVKKTRGCDEGNEGMISGMVKENRPGVFVSEEHLDLEPRPPLLVSSDSSEEVPFYVGRPPCSKLPIVQEDVKIVGKDDDENSSGCTQPSNVTLKGYCPANQWDRKFRNLLSSKTWKVTPAILINGNPHNEDVETEHTFCSRKTNYKRRRTQRFPASMRRRSFPWSPLSTSIESEDVSKSTDKCVYEEVAAATTRAKQAGGGVSSSIEIPKSSVKSSEAKVKLSIKSFMVPELLIEMPKSATIGALKRTVMEVVTTILGGGLQVGVLLEGKRIHDDTKTLIQTGISCDGKLEDVGFMLDPNTFHAAKQSSIDLCSPFSQETEPFKRYNPAENSVLGVDEPAAAGPLQTDASTYAESCCDQISSAANLSAKKLTSNSQALIAMPTVSMEALAVLPLHCKSRHGERVQRRIRRPFSVSEVEALVKAVEKLGTGRWRDVKLLEFDNAKHRTYVDLKDKWKTLVHTAGISPQQRRGEPVPQDLLDRVLCAQAYWSQKQTK